MLSFADFLLEAKYYIGVVQRGNVRVKAFSALTGSTSHLDEFPAVRLASQRFRYDAGTHTLTLNDSPTQEDYFAILNWLERERLKVKYVDDSWGTKTPIDNYDPRKLDENRDQLLEASLTKIRHLLRVPLDVSLQPGYISVIPMLGKYADQATTQQCYAFLDRIEKKEIPLAPVRQVTVRDLVPTQYTLEGEDVMDIMRKQAFDKPIWVLKLHGKLLILNGHHRAAAAASLGRSTIPAHVFFYR